VSPAQLATIDAEFEKVSNAPVPEISKIQKGLGLASSSISASASVDNLFPRVDISSQINAALLEVCALVYLVI
jgi:hypothetical protein